MRKQIREMMNKSRKLDDSNRVVLCQTTEIPALWLSFPNQFRQKLQLSQQGCWVWTGSRRSRVYKNRRYSYGTYNAQLVHRITYEQFRGEIPDHLELDHLCHNKLCCNPDHLEAVTHQQNCARRKKSGPYPSPNSIRSRRGDYLGRYE